MLLSWLKVMFAIEKSIAIKGTTLISPLITRFINEVGLSKVALQYNYTVCRSSFCSSFDELTAVEADSLSGMVYGVWGD